MKGKKKYLLVVLLLVMFGFGSYVTYSLYRTSISGNGSIDTAKWSVVVKKGSTAVSNVNFSVSDITWTTHTGKNNTIAPGDSGYIDYTIDASGSEVDVLYTVSTDTITGGAPATGFSVSLGSGQSSGTIPYATGTSGMVQNVRMTITWTGGTGDSSSKDTTDIAANDHTLTIPLELTARQKLAGE
jgi:hypothetical protein